MSGQQDSWRQAEGVDDVRGKEGDESNGRQWRRGNQRWGAPGSGQFKREQSHESIGSGGSGSRETLSDRDLRERVLFSLISLVGKNVVVRMKGGKTYKGVFHGAGTKGPLGVVLKAVERIHPPVEDGEKPEKRETLVVNADDFVEVVAEDMVLDCTSKRSPRRGGTMGGMRSPDHSDRLHLDSDLASSKRRDSKGEKVLERWVPDANLQHSGALELEHGGSTWDQFEVNKRLYGVESTWNEDLYTKKLDKTQVPHHIQREADRLAREIEKQKSSNVHIQEERGQIQAKEDYADLDEEARYSAVARDQPVVETKPQPELKSVPLLKTLGGLKAISNLNPNARTWAPTTPEKGEGATTSTSHTTLTAGAREFVPGQYSAPKRETNSMEPLKFADMCNDAFYKRQKEPWSDPSELAYTWPTARGRSSSQMADDEVYATSAYGYMNGNPMYGMGYPYPMPMIPGRGPQMPVPGNYPMRVSPRIGVPPMMSPASSTGPTPPRNWAGYHGPQIPMGYMPRGMPYPGMGSPQAPTAGIGSESQMMGGNWPSNS